MTVHTKVIQRYYQLMLLNPVKKQANDTKPLSFDV